MIAVLDTNVVISGDVPAGYTSYCISSATVAELKLGIALADTPRRRIARATKLLDILTVFGSGIPFDDEVAEAYAVIVSTIRTLGGRHRGRTMDLIIAATAMSLEGVVVSADAAGFTLIDPGLVRVVPPIQ